MKNASYCVSYGKEGRLQQNEQKNSFCYSPFKLLAARGQVLADIVRHKSRLGTGFTAACELRPAACGPRAPKKPFTGAAYIWYYIL